MADELSKLKIVAPDDKNIIAAAKWMPRIELACCGKRCLMLGGHCAATNSIMVWCTCEERDEAHPDGSRLLALDSWVVEHCRQETLGKYDDSDEDEDEGEADEGYSSKLDRLCMEEAMVLRAGPNVLPKQVPLRQLLSSALVAQGGNKGLKGASFWVYWYDQPIPTPKMREYEGMGTLWAPGPLARPGLGVWYRARIVKCYTTSGVVEVRYDIDKTDGSLYLLIAFAHFDVEPPSMGTRPEVLPDTDLVECLGLPPSATSGGGKRKGSKASGQPGSKAGHIIGTKRPAETLAHAAGAAAQLPPPRKPAVEATAKPTAAEATAKPTAVEATAKPTAAEATAKPTAVEATAKPKPKPTAAEAAAAVGPAPGAAKAKAKPKPPAAAAVSTAPAAAKTSAAAAAAAAAPPVGPPKKIKIPVTASKALSPPAPPSSSAAPQGAAVQFLKKHASAATAAAAAAEPLPYSAGGSRTGRPRAKRPCHEFDSVALASSNPGRASAAGLGAPTPEAWAQMVERARRRPGFQGPLAGCQEQVPVVMFNDVDDASVPEFDYVSGADFEARLEGDLEVAVRQQPALGGVMDELQALCEAAKPSWGAPCGLSYHKAVRQREEEEKASGRTAAASSEGAVAGLSYGADGRLLVTRPFGVHECGAACSSPACQANMLLSRGLQRPLEVFRTRDWRWGLRCSEPLDPGDLVAPLLGRLAAAQPLAEAAATAAAGDHARCGWAVAPGVVLLNHFFGLWEAVFTRGLNWCQQHLQLWQLPPNPLSHALCNCGGRPSGGGGGDSDPARPVARRLASMLAIDTRSAGNAVRFVRQWTPEIDDGGAGPALVAQPVLAGGCRTPILYYIGLFAARRVEALEELTCDFSAMSLDGGGPGGWAGSAR